MSNLQKFGPQVKGDQMAPTFQLKTIKDQTIKLWEYKQRKSLVIYFLPEPNDSLFADLQENYPAYKTLQTELIVIVTHWEAGLAERERRVGGLDYPVISNLDPTLYKRYLNLTGVVDIDNGLPAALFITDRYGAIVRYALDDLPPQTEILAVLEYLNILCNP